MSWTTRAKLMSANIKLIKAMAGACMSPSARPHLRIAVAVCFAVRVLCALRRTLGRHAQRSKIVANATGGGADTRLFNTCCLPSALPRGLPASAQQVTVGFCAQKMPACGTGRPQHVEQGTRKRDKNQMSIPQHP